MNYYIALLLSLTQAVHLPKDKSVRQADGTFLVLKAEHPGEAFGHLFDHTDPNQMDQFYHPDVFGWDIEDIYNTHHTEEPHPGPYGYWNWTPEPTAKDEEMYFLA